jgi:hypothetical protein
LALEENYEGPSGKKIKIYKESPAKLFGVHACGWGSEREFFDSSCMCYKYVRAWPVTSVLGTKQEKSYSFEHGISAGRPRQDWEGRV